jgi:hypothetical protein
MLTPPFLLSMPGVDVEEIEPWTEGGNNEHVLDVEFPDAIATHWP